MTERMRALRGLSERQPVTHSCPACSGPVRCDIEQGKSTCWCFSVQAKEVEWGDKCLCKTCLGAK